MKKVIYLLISILVLTGCGKKEVIQVDVEPVIKEEETLKIMDPNSKTRPIGIMINNHPAARPYHAGLQDSYLIYEVIVEGGFTRFLALFKDQDTSKIGSVRSARHYFLDYALENDAIYVHFGGSERALTEVGTLNMSNINFITSPGSFRDKTMNTAFEHTAFTKMEDLNKVIKNRGFRTESEVKLLNYSIDEVELKDSFDANKINFEYSSVVKNEYNYNSNKKVYERKVNNVDHKDFITKEIYTFKNIIIYKSENFRMDSYGRQDLKNIGKTEGYFITNGKAVKIDIEKKTRKGQTTYKYKDGSDVVLNDGNTFIQIIPISKTININ